MASDQMRGRWGGRLTSRPLPDSDPTLAQLAPAERACVSAVWLGRAASERRVADSFVVVRDALRALAAAPSLVELAERSIDDEMRHAELSRVVASAYAGRDLPGPPPLALTIPRHANVGVRTRHVLHVVGQCALNETIASVFLEAALAEVTAPLAATALRELLSDEVDHARIGWALLASVPRDTLRDVEMELPGMSIANLRMWRSAERSYPDDGRLAAHGAPPLATIERALITAFRDLIVPGFDALGISTVAIVQWLDAGAPTLP